MEVMKYIEKKRQDGCLHFTLIDPDKQKPEKAGKLAALVESAGSDAIMVGGSQPDVVLQLDNAVKHIKDSCRLPVILFPSSHASISQYADAVFFMSLFNSRSVQYVIEEPTRGSVVIKKYGIEPLPMAYLIVESGSTTSAGLVGDVKPIPRDKPEFAASYALAARYFGMKFVYLEGGSGAEHPVPPEMVAAVKKATGNNMFVIVGGGIRDPETAKGLAAAGADVIVTGTIAEESSEKLKQIIKALKN